MLPLANIFNFSINMQIANLLIKKAQILYLHG